MILTVGNIKGGVGKTLLAVNIAAVLAHRGRDVLLIDGDEQGSAATFAGIRAEIAAPVAFATIRLQGAAIRQQMKQIRDKYDEIVVDVGGRDTGSLRAALTVADVVLVPSSRGASISGPAGRSGRSSPKRERSMTPCAPTRSSLWRIHRVGTTRMRCPLFVGSRGSTPCHLSWGAARRSPTPSRTV